MQPFWLIVEWLLGLL